MTAETLSVERVPEVSFVVIAYNEELHVEATLKSLLSQEGLTDYEIVVVDDGSSDGTRQIVGQLGESIPEIRLVCHGQNRGRGAARATGVEAARGRFIVMSDGDVLFPRHWWSTCRAHLDGYDAVGGTAVPDGDVAYVHSRTGLIPRVRSASTVVPGSNGAFRAEALRSVGVEPDLTEGEDVALNHALRAAGFRLFSVPGLTVAHREAKGFAASLRWMLVSGTGATRQLWRYRELRVPDAVFGGWLCGVAALVLRPRRRTAGLLAAYTVAAAGAHVGQRFEARRNDGPRFVQAVALDAVMLSAYFLGRSWGVPVLLARKLAGDRRLRRERGPSGTRQASPGRSVPS